MSARSWFARHVQTLVGSLGRLVQQPAAALMTMAVIGVALALPLFLNVFLQNARAATANWNQAFDVSVYLDKKAAAARTQALARELRARADVAGVRIITANEALAQFRETSGFGNALDELNENPLPDTLVVTPALAASTPEGMAKLEAAIAAAPGVQTVQVDGDWVRRLDAMADILRRIVWLIGGLLGFGVVLVVGNTIRLDILNRRSEIEVMKLVGATDGFTRRPFLYSGVWYGLGGGLLAVVIVGIAVASMGQPVRRLAGLYGSRFHLHGLGFGATLVVWCGAGALGWLGSWLAVSRHLRAATPA